MYKVSFVYEGQKLPIKKLVDVDDCVVALGVGRSTAQVVAVALRPMFHKIVPGDLEIHVDWYSAQFEMFPSLFPPPVGLVHVPGKTLLDQA